jgi:hypothetical protein
MAVCVQLRTTDELSRLSPTTLLFRFQEYKNSELELGKGTFMLMDHPSPSLLLEQTLQVSYSGVFVVDIFMGSTKEGWPGINRICRSTYSVGARGTTSWLASPIAQITICNATGDLPPTQRAVLHAIHQRDASTSRDIDASARAWNLQIGAHPLAAELKSDETVATYAHLYRVLGVDTREPSEFFFDRILDLPENAIWDHLERAAEYVVHTRVAPDGSPWGESASWRDVMWLHLLLTAYCHAVSYISDLTLGMPTKDDMFEMACLNRAGDCEDLSAQVGALMAFILNTAAPSTTSPTLKRLLHVAKHYRPFIAIVTIEGGAESHMIHIVPVLLCTPTGQAQLPGLPRSLLVEATNLHSPADITQDLQVGCSLAHLVRCNEITKELRLFDSAITEICHPHRVYKSPSSMQSRELYGEKLGRNNGAHNWYHSVLEVIGQDGQRLVCTDKGIGMTFGEFMNHSAPLDLVQTFPLRAPRRRPQKRVQREQVKLDVSSPVYTSYTSLVGITPEKIARANEVLQALSPPGAWIQRGGILTVTCGFWNLCSNLEAAEEMLAAMHARFANIGYMVHDVDILPQDLALPPHERVRVVSFLLDVSTPRTSLDLQGQSGSRDKMANGTYLRSAQQLSKNSHNSFLLAGSQARMEQCNAGLRVDVPAVSVETGRSMTEKDTGRFESYPISKLRAAPSFLLRRESAPPARTLALAQAPDSTDTDTSPATESLEDSPPTSTDIQDEWEHLMGQSFGDYDVLVRALQNMSPFNAALTIALRSSPPDAANKLTQLILKMRQEYRPDIQSYRNAHIYEVAKYLTRALRNEAFTPAPRLAAAEITALIGSLDAITSPDKPTRVALRRTQPTTVSRPVDMNEGTRHDTKLRTRMLSILRAEIVKDTKEAAEQQHILAEEALLLPFTTPSWYIGNAGLIANGIQSLINSLALGGAISHTLANLKDAVSESVAPPTVIAVTLVRAALFAPQRVLSQRNGLAWDRVQWLYIIGRCYCRCTPLTHEEQKHMDIALGTLLPFLFDTAPRNFAAITTDTTLRLRADRASETDHLLRETIPSLPAAHPALTFAYLDGACRAMLPTSVLTAMYTAAQDTWRNAPSISASRFIVRVLSTELSAIAKHGTSAQRGIPHDGSAPNFGARNTPSSKGAASTKPSQQSASGADKQTSKPLASGTNLKADTKGVQKEQAAPKQPQETQKQAGDESMPPPTSFLGMAEAEIEKETKAVISWAARQAKSAVALAKDVREWLATCWGNAKTTIKAGWTALKGIIESGWIATVDFFKNLDMEKIKTFFTHVVREVTAYIKEFYADMRDVYEDMREFHNTYTKAEAYYAENESASVFGTRCTTK